MAELLTYLTRAQDASTYYARGLYRQLEKKDIFLWAQAIAFKVLITIVPVLILATGIVGNVLKYEKPFETVSRYVRDFLPTYQTEQFLATLRQLSNVSDTLTLIGIFGLLFSAFTLFTTLRVAVGNVFQEEWHEDRSILGGYLFDLRMVGQVGLFFLLTLGLPIVLRSAQTAGFALLERMRLDYVPVLQGWEWFIKALILLIPFLVTTAMFFQLFFFVPKPHPPKRSVLFGALFTAVLWEAAKSGFALYALYVGRFDRYSGGESARALGDTFGLIIALVFWVYYSGVVLCLGAVMVLLHEKRHRSRREAPPAMAQKAPPPERTVAPEEIIAPEGADAAIDAVQPEEASRVDESPDAEDATPQPTTPTALAEASVPAAAAPPTPEPGEAPRTNGPPAASDDESGNRGQPEPTPPEKTQEDLSVN